MGIINWQKELLPFEQAVDELIVKFNGIKRDYMRLDKQCPIEQVEGRVKKVSSILEKANRRNIPINQAIDKLGDNLKIIATSSDNIIEAIESDDKKTLAFQFHPEKLRYNERKYFEKEVRTFLIAK